MKGLICGSINQTELPQIADRIVVGREGGIAYVLFKSGTIPEHYTVSTFLDRDEVVDFFKRVQDYINESASHARTFGFYLVSLNPFSKLIIPYSPNINMCNAGIGATKIESSENVESFLAMVKDVSVNLEDRVKDITAAGKIISIRNLVI